MKQQYLQKYLDGQTKALWEDYENQGLVPIDRNPQYNDQLPYNMDNQILDLTRNYQLRDELFPQTWKDDSQKSPINALSQQKQELLNFLLEASKSNQDNKPFTGFKPLPNANLINEKNIKLAQQYANRPANISENDWKEQEKQERKNFAQEIFPRKKGITEDRDMYSNAIMNPLSIAYMKPSTNSDSAAVVYDLPRLKNYNNEVQSGITHELAHLLDFKGNNLDNRVQNKQDFLYTTNKMADHMQNWKQKNQQDPAWQQKHRIHDPQMFENQLNNMGGYMKVISDLATNSRMPYDQLVREIVGYTTPKLFDNWLKPDVENVDQTIALQQEIGRKILKRNLKDTANNWKRQGLTKERKPNGELKYNQIIQAFNKQIEHLRRPNSAKKDKGIKYLNVQEYIDPTFTYKQHWNTYKQHQDNPQGLAKDLAEYFRNKGW